jgi:hypothetical protein
VSEPFDDLLTFAERAYVRMEAEQLIAQCLQHGDPKPFDSLIEGLVLAGSSSIGVMREILDELRSTKTYLTNEGLDIRKDLVDALDEFGISIPSLLTADVVQSFRKMTSKELGTQVVERSPHLEPEDEALLSEICLEAGERVRRIARRMSLLSKLEDAVRDWIVSLAYMASHQTWDTFGEDIHPYQH